MQRFLVSVLFLLSAVGTSHAQTIKITTANGPCTYPTGAVTQDASVPGQLLATVPAGQTPSGTGCGSSAVSYGAVTYVASPLTLTTAMPLANTGGTANFTFQPVNADHCTGSITPVGTAATGAAFTSTFCSSLAGCQTLQNVSATFPTNNDQNNLASYTVAVSCTGPGSTTAVVSPSQTVTVQKAGTVQTTGCTTPPTVAGTTAPTGFLTVASWTMRPATANTSVSYFGFGSQNVDPTSFTSVFNLPNRTVHPWPGTYNADPVINLPINQYLSLAFHTAIPPAKYFTASNVPSSLFGEYQVGSSSFTATVSMTISTSCGDFGQSTTVVPGCVLNKGGDSSFFQWQNAGTCVLHDNTQYYLNVINADISSFPAKSTAKSSVCPGSSCTVPLINGPGDWNNYTPSP
jgi:hypothetical protein